jgi:hypothetical protein
MAPAEQKKKDPRDWKGLQPPLAEYDLSLFLALTNAPC